MDKVDANVQYIYIWGTWGEPSGAWTGIAGMHNGVLARPVTRFRKQSLQKFNTCSRHRKRFAGAVRMQGGHYEYARCSGPGGDTVVHPYDRIT